MKVAFALFDGMTSLDFVGFYDALTRLLQLQALQALTWDLCATEPTIGDDRGMKLHIKQVRPDLSAYDLVFVPGGMATRTLRYDESFLAWLRTIREDAYKVSVCTGSLLLGAAGFLNGKCATINSSCYELLAPYCAEVIRARVVRDGLVVTGGGVASSLDLGLFVCELLAGAETAGKIQEGMHYPFYRPGQVQGDFCVYIP